MLTFIVSNCRRPYNTVACDPTGRLVALAGWDCLIKVWDILENKRDSVCSVEILSLTIILYVLCFNFHRSLGKFHGRDCSAITHHIFIFTVLPCNSEFMDTNNKSYFTSAVSAFVLVTVAL